MSFTKEYFYKQLEELSESYQSKFYYPGGKLIGFTKSRDSQFKEVCAQHAKKLRQVSPRLERVAKHIEAGELKAAERAIGELDTLTANKVPDSTISWIKKYS